MAAAQPVFKPVQAPAVTGPGIEDRLLLLASKQQDAERHRADAECERAGRPEARLRELQGR